MRRLRLTGLLIVVAVLAIAIAGIAPPVADAAAALVIGDVVMSIRAAPDVKPDDGLDGRFGILSSRRGPEPLCRHDMFSTALASAEKHHLMPGDDTNPGPRRI
mgnify:CR=1 FL=1